MLRILIADDHTVVRRGLRQILMDDFPAAVVDEVADAEALVKKVMTDTWNVVITDLNMPGRRGLDALYQVKQISPHLPVLFLSDHPEEQYAWRVLKARASGDRNTVAAPTALLKAEH